MKKLLRGAQELVWSIDGQAGQAGSSGQGVGHAWGRSAHIVALASFVWLLLSRLLVLGFIDVLRCGGFRLPAALRALLLRHDEGPALQQILQSLASDGAARERSNLGIRTDIAGGTGLNPQDESAFHALAMSSRKRRMESIASQCPHALQRD